MPFTHVGPASLHVLSWDQRNDCASSSRAARWGFALRICAFKL